MADLRTALRAPTKESIAKLAAKLQVPGRSSMTKDALVDAVIGADLPISALLRHFRLADLKQIAAASGAPAGGTKAELCARLAHALTSDEAAPAEYHVEPDMAARRAVLASYPKQDRVGVLRVLAWLATRDDRFADEEHDFLLVVADSLSLSTEEAAAAIEEGRLADRAQDAVGTMKSHSMRHLLLSELVLLAFADGDYDARERTGLRRISRALGLPDSELAVVERAVVDAIKDLTAAAPTAVEEPKSGWSWPRIGLVAGGAVLGGAALALTGGLAAPVIGGAIGSTFLGLSGAAATSAGLAAIGGGSVAVGGFGMAGGTAVVAGLFGGAGAATMAVKTARRTSGVSQFDFIDLGVGGARIVIGISGFLSQESDFTSDWNGLRAHYAVASTRALRWESKTLMDLGSAVGTAGAAAAARISVGRMAKGAARGAGGLLNLPTAVFAAMSLIDNPWSVARDKAEKTGVALAKTLASRPWGSRPVTLVGFSLGARVIHSALRSLSRSEISGIVESVILLGGAVDAADSDWDDLTRAVTGPIVNGWCETDYILRYLYQATELARPIGLAPIGRDRVVDVDLTDIVHGHVDYRPKLSGVLQRVAAVAEETDPEFWV